MRVDDEISPCSFLLVDDDAAFRDRLARSLRDRGFDVRIACDANEAIALATADSPERAVVDLRMPGALSGLDVVRALREIDATTEIVVLTGYGSIATALEAVRRGARDYLSKPVALEALLAAFDPKAVHDAEIPDTVPSLARVEWEHIQRVLTDCDNNISHASRLLGIHRRSLQRKLSKYPARR